MKTIFRFLWDKVKALCESLFVYVLAALLISSFFCGLVDFALTIIQLLVADGRLDKTTPWMFISWLVYAPSLLMALSGILYFRGKRIRGKFAFPFAGLLLAQTIAIIGGNPDMNLVFNWSETTVKISFFTMIALSLWFTFIFHKKGLFELVIGVKTSVVSPKKSLMGAAGWMKEKIAEEREAELQKRAAVLLKERFSEVITPKKRRVL